MVEELDAGPVYLKRPMALSGSAQEIFERSAVLIYDMVEEIERTHPTPSPQEGEPTVFARRKPPDSELPSDPTPQALYDFIRMLDAETYPLAFIDLGPWRVLFNRAELLTAGVVAKATFVKRPEPGQ